MTKAKITLWAPGDVNAFFGLGTNILVNMLTVTALLRFILKVPDKIIFGSILPATALMICLSTFYYGWLAYKVAKNTGRSDVCALPSGISTPHLFVVVFVVMLPISIKTGDPLAGWAAGLAWVFLQSFILMIGGFIAPYIRKVTPRAALLGALAGTSISFISLLPVENMFATPIIGLTCFSILLLSWFGEIRYGGIPAGLVAIVVGCAIAWGSNFLGLHYSGMSLANVKSSFSNFGIYLPVHAFGHVFLGLKYIGVILITAIPFGIYDLIEAMDNVESASAAGDHFPMTKVLVAGGIFSLIGCLLGNPFINAVYIGHPGWKAMGGRIGYSVGVGIMAIILAWFGLISVMTALIPMVALYPILLYVGMMIGAQAFQETPKIHAPAVVISLLPSIAAWGYAQIKNALEAAGISDPYSLGLDKLAAHGILFQGLETLGSGAAIVGMVWGATTTFIIDRDFGKASVFALAGGILSFFGIMHGPAVGINVSPEISISYLITAGILAACAWLVPRTSIPKVEIKDDSLSYAKSDLPPAILAKEL